VYAAPKLDAITSRHVWDEASPAMSGAPVLDYTPRVGVE
jgi:hypothetical protein